MTAYEMLRALPVGRALKLTSDKDGDLDGRVSAHKSDRTVVFCGKWCWLELTEQSDIEFRGPDRLHVY
jgi:hypothetical protein